MFNANRIIEFEQYYTPSNIAKQLLSEIDRDIWDRTQFIIEPSCGKGAFMFSDKPTIGFDIDPKITGDNIHEIDFLKDDVTKYIPTESDPNSVLCVGNPPFGTNSKDAKQFINKCFQFSNNVFMIVPISIAIAETGMNGLNSYIHIQSFKQLEDSIFEDQNGKRLRNVLRTAWVHFVKRDFVRPKMIRINSGSNWIDVPRTGRILKGDIAIFRYSPKIVILNDDHGIPREVNHIIRYTGQLDIDQLKQTIKDWRKIAKQQSTTGMLNITKQHLGRMLNDLVK